MTHSNAPYRSRIAGLRALSIDARLDAIATSSGLAAEQLTALSMAKALPAQTVDGMIENVIGTFELPLGVAANFVVNGKDYLIPMAVEEPSVVAAASYMAKIVGENGGFQATASDPIMRAQIQLLRVEDPGAAKHALLAAKSEIIALANSKDKTLIDLGGGCRDIEVHIFENTRIGHMVVLHLLVDVRDAMGANTVNTMAEMVAPLAERIAAGEARLRILSNLADLRTVKVHIKVAPNTLATKNVSGDEYVDGIVEACALAEIDPYRAATHNKGIMNGIDPVVIATGNDWRAVEAGAHAWAARKGHYTSLTRWDKDGDGNLEGTIELPMPVGLVGGATKTHPSAGAALELMRITSAAELGMVIAAVGLAQNMAALRALATEGIQKGHMALHARNIAIVAGATGPEIETVAKALVHSGDITTDNAQRLLQTQRAAKSKPET
ncbi:hydroxymethylglutaryl-CoA reductase, degradative [Planktotalea sp.]|uniref:hydroxymethylglutaryl-CoA reductase, degradative n=1 Tax=Planktotalea sp. TaxID=2029877 RepID=UPI003D6B848A